jgi:hypothetical protein
MQPIGLKDLTYYTKQRTRIEVDLAKSMYAVFNSDPIISSLRDIISLAIGDLASWGAKGNHVRDVQAAFREEKKLAVWKGEPKTGEGLFNVWKRRNTWTAAECADLLRLFGTVIEKTKIGENVAEEQAMHGVGDGRAEHEAARVGGDARFKNITDGTAGRAREGAYDFKTQEVTNPRPVNYVEASHTAAGRKLIQKVKMGGHDAFWGIGPFRLLPQSTLRKIDIAFGLPEGADISGTTADSIFGIGRAVTFANSAQMVLGGNVPVALLKLLPLVSMIAQGHHTIVESAAVLSLNKLITYNIGFYSSLLPSSDKVGTNDQLGELRKLTAAAEANSFNVPLVAFYDEDKKVYAGVLFNRNDRAEMKKFREIATVSEDFLERFRGIGGLVTRTDLYRILDL